MTPQARLADFAIRGDGDTRGDDAHRGELAALTLYVARALAPVDGLLGVGLLNGIHAQSADLVLEVELSHAGDFGVQANGSMHRSAKGAGRVDPRPRVASVTVEIGFLLSAVSEVDFVAGCFLVSPGGSVVADKLPGVSVDAMAGAAERVRVAREGFARFLGPVSLVCTFEWLQLIAAPVANGTLIVVTDVDSIVADVTRAVRSAGAGMTDVDLEVVPGPRG